MTAYMYLVYGECTDTYNEMIILICTELSMKHIP